MSTPTYDPARIIYTFSSSADAVADYDFPNLTDMQNWATLIESAVLRDQTIQGMIGGDWTSVWGPVVYSNDTTGSAVVADNTMGCYYSPSQNMFVIAVAGTNPFSTFDWTTEDFDVSKLVPWTTISPGAPVGSGSVSAGTANGLNILFNVMLDNGITLLAALSAFIAAKPASATATVAVCGHSLGGALSPCVALYMVENLTAWGGSAAQPVWAYPTAGPSPGESGFASYYGTKIASNSITYVSLYNSLDVVPLAWAGLANLPSIYDTWIKPTDSPTDLFTGIVASGLFMNAFLSGGTYTQVPGSQSLQGTFNAAEYSGYLSLLKYALDNYLPAGLSQYAPYAYALAQYAVQVVYQHTTAYTAGDGANVAGLLNIDSFTAEFQNVLKANPPQGGAEIDVTATAVKRLTGIDPRKLSAIPRSASA